VDAVVNAVVNTVDEGKDNIIAVIPEETAPITEKIDDDISPLTVKDE
jgi:hypothetical protein